MAAPAERDEHAVGAIVRIADPGLAARILRTLEREPRIRLVDEADEADVMIADVPADWDGPVVAIVAEDGDLAPWRGEIRALLRPDAGAAAIAAAVIAAAAGLVVLSPDLLEDLGWNTAADGEMPIVLTPREEEVLRLLAEGATNKAIARRLGISVHTAKFHVASLLAKLGASGRAAAIAAAIRRGLLMI